MSPPAVRTVAVTKRFHVVHRRKTALRVVKAIVRGEPLRGEQWVLRGVDLRIGQGERIALLGRNGCGKTTLLRIIAGIIEPSGGQIECINAPAALMAPGAAFLPDLEVVSNLYLAGAIFGIPREILRQREREVLETAGVEHLAYSPLKELSSGQLQRLAFSVFAQNEAAVVILDEIFTNVDRQFFRTADDYFQKMAREGRTVLMTSHDSSTLTRYCDRGVWLEGGRVREDGPVREVVGSYESSFAFDDGLEPTATARWF